MSYALTSCDGRGQHSGQGMHTVHIPARCYRHPRSISVCLAHDTICRVRPLARLANDTIRRVRPLARLEGLRLRRSASRRSQAVDYSCPVHCAVFVYARLERLTKFASRFSCGVARSGELPGEVPSTFIAKQNKTAMYIPQFPSQR